MLEKAQRLRINREFKTVYNLKRSVANSLLILYAGKKKETPESKTKAGFVVSKKIHKRATKRNRIKRLIREAYRNFLKENPSRDIIWSRLIFLARQPMLNTSYNETRLALEDCLKRIEKFSKND